MSSSIQDQNMAENKVNDAPVEAPVEKGKGKAENAMDDDEDDSESGEETGAEQVEEADEDNMEEIDEENIMGRRTRGRNIDFAEADKNLEVDDEDEEEDEDFVDEEDKMEDGLSVLLSDRKANKTSKKAASSDEAHEKAYHINVTHGSPNKRFSSCIYRALRANAFLEEAGEGIEDIRMNWMHPFTELRHEKLRRRFAGWPSLSIMQ
ncbi:hypothetical protein Q7P36_009897 [Cladosporium allicinum]